MLCYVYLRVIFRSHQHQHTSQENSWWPRRCGWPACFLLKYSLLSRLKEWKNQWKPLRAQSEYRFAASRFSEAPSHETEDATQVRTTLVHRHNTSGDVGLLTSFIKHCHFYVMVPRISFFLSSTAAHPTNFCFLLLLLFYSCLATQLYYWLIKIPQNKIIIIIYLNLKFTIYQKSMMMQQL